MRYVLPLLLVFFIIAPAHASQKVSMINVYKAQRVMILSDERGKPLKTYKISLGKNPVGHKRREGDKKTPEGRYYISDRNPNSNYHLSLKISYPNDQDWNIAERFGYPPGGMIMIHGMPNGKGNLGSAYRNGDWTDGCIAVGNKEIEEIWSLVDDGTPIQIWP